MATTQIAGGYQIWQIGTKLFVVYRGPNTKGQDGKGVPMAWYIGSPQIMADLGLAGQKPHVRLTEAQAKRLGVTYWGDAREIKNKARHPFNEFVSSFAKEARVNPMLRDPEVLALWAHAIIEGRTPSEAELRNTAYFRTRTEAERDWILLQASDPKTAAQRLKDAELRVKDMMHEFGWNAPDPNVIHAIAKQWVTGKWTERQTREQVRKVSDPHYSGAYWFAGRELKPGWEVHEYNGKYYIRGKARISYQLKDPVEIAYFMKYAKKGVKPHVIGKQPTRQDWLNITVLKSGSSTAPNVEEVRDLVLQWLGPTYGGWNDAEIQKWASRITTNENARAQLEEVLRRQRLALFPEYTNQNLTYEDIATPWRAVFQDMWGQAPDEKDPFWTKVVRTNDQMLASQMLRDEGLKRGVEKVRAQLYESMRQSLGDGVLDRGV